MFCTCGNVIPKQRTDLGFNRCVSCSDVKKVAGIDVVYHKTGNTIEITSQETAERMNALSKRTSFGTMRCMKGKKSDTYDPKNIKIGASLSMVGSKESYERTGEKMMLVFQALGYDEALKEIDSAKSKLDINVHQAMKLKCILDALSPKIEETQHVIRYHNTDHQEKKDTEIDIAFKQWKNT